MLQKVVKNYISATHGWAVADQFEVTFDGEGFEKQNLNALIYIRKAVNELLNSDVLNEDAFDELQTYADALEDYLVEANKGVK